MKKLLLSTFALAAFIGASAMEAPEALYMIGEVAGNNWDPQVGVPMELIEPGIFKLENVELQKENSYFGFASLLDPEWSVLNSNRYGSAVQDGEVFNLEEGNTFNKSENSWQLPKGTYTFYVNFNTNTVASTLDATMTGEPGDNEPGNGENEPTGPGPEVSVTPPAQLYLIGGPAGWDPPTSSNYECSVYADGVFMLENVSFGAGEFFAFTGELGESGNTDQEIWDTVNAARVAPTAANAAFDTVEANPFVYGEDRSWQMLEAGTYNFYINFNNMNVATTYEADVKTISANLDAPKVYYNLQGVRVNNPIKGGIYIVNGKKVVF